MLHPIFALVGPSGAGKTALSNDALAVLHDRVAIVPSITTRPRREADDDRYYQFMSNAEFEALVEAGRMVHHVEYAGFRYGNDRRKIDALLGRCAGIGAYVEAGVQNFRSAGYRVIVVRIIPDRIDPARSSERATADEARAREILTADVVIMNSFAPGGREAAARELIEFIRARI